MFFHNVSGINELLGDVLFVLAQASLNGNLVDFHMASH